MSQTKASSPRLPPVEVASRLRLVLARLVRLTRQDGGAGGLSSAQLSALASIEARAGVRLGELASLEGVVPSTMTRLVATLEGAGLVRRAPAPQDARSSVVSATQEGAALLARLRGDYVSELADRLGALEGASFERLAAALPALEAVVAEPER